MMETNTKPCWRRNGTWGDEKPRCDKLKFVEHCRNCSVFENAAREAMSTDNVEKGFNGELLSFDALVQRQRSSGDVSILPVRLEQYCIAIPCSQIITIHDHVPIHTVPFNLNSIVKGVVAINHEIYTFINFGSLLSLPPATKSKLKNREIGLYKRVIVVNFDSRIMAFYVDEVYPIFRYFEAAVNELASDSFLQHLSSGYLLEEKEWCGDCHIVDFLKVSKIFEKTFYE